MTTADSILRRKAGAAGKPEITTMTPEKAMKLAFGRAGRAVEGLGLRMTAFSMDRGSVSALPGMAREGSLVVTLARDGALGGAGIVDSGVISALIEAETMGRVGRAEAEPRRATRIDALVVSGFLESALTSFDELAAELSIAPVTLGWRPADMVPDPSVLPLTLEDVPLRLFRLGLDFAEGARKGGVTLALPLEARSADRPGGAARGLGPDLQDAVLAARADIRAVLGKVSLPLSGVSKWEPGAVVPLPRELLTQVRIEDIDGVTVACGRLGQVNGARAVRIVSTGPV